MDKQDNVNRELARKGGEGEPGLLTLLENFHGTHRWNRSGNYEKPGRVCGRETGEPT